MGCCGTRVKLGSAIAVGSIFLIAGISLIFVFQNVLKDEIKQQIGIKAGTSTYDSWTNPPADIYLQFWVFDVKNPYEVLHKGDPPVVVQKGPYTYIEHLPKINVQFHNNNGTVSFEQPKTLIFNREKSVGPDSDKFRTINLVLLTAIEFLRYESVILKSFINFVLENLLQEQLYTEYSVHEILWGLSSDPIIEKIHEFCDSHNISINLTLGLFSNGSTDGVYTIYTGVDDVSKFNIIDKWNGAKDIDIWSTKYARMINGTDGTLYPPFVKKSEEINIFSSDICRSIYLDYEKERVVKDINVYRFIPPSRLFANISVNPGNAGFCTPDENSCLQSGVMNMSLCQHGAPVVVSLPHFYQGSPNYINGVIGLHPKKDEHETYVDLEPTTGVAMNVAKKLQLNLAVHNVSGFSETGIFGKLLIHPLLWLNESAVISDKAASDFRSQVILPMLIMQAVQYGLIVLGGFILLVTALVIIKLYIQKKKKPLENASLVCNIEENEDQ